MRVRMKFPEGKRWSICQDYLYLDPVSSISAAKDQNPTSLAYPRMNRSVTSQPESELQVITGGPKAWAYWDCLSPQLYPCPPWWLKLPLAG